LPAEVDFVQPMGAVSYAILRLPGEARVIAERDHLIAAVGPDDELPRGLPVWLEAKGDRVCLFRPDTGQSIAAS
jgi:hypothetical protein